MFRLRTASISLALMGILLCWHSALQAEESLDIRFVSRDAVAAVVLHPKKLLAAPELQMLPVEVAIAAGIEHLGIDPSEVDTAVGILSLTGLPMGMPGMGAVLHFAKPFDQDRVMRVLGQGTNEATHAGKTYHASGAPNGLAFHIADERTLVVATSLQMKAMLAAKDVDTPLVKLLKQADTSPAVVALLDFATVRPLVQLGLGNLPPLPPDWQELLQLVDLVQSITLGVNFTDGLDVNFTLAGRDADAAAKIEQLLQKAKELARTLIQSQIAEAIEADGSETAKAMAQYVRRISGQLIDAIEIKTEAEKVHVAVLKGTPAIAATGVAVALLLPAVQAAREAARRNEATNHLKQIGIGILNHHDTYKSFPAQSINDKDGKPLLSWRVKILPFVEEMALYQEFHLDEPWDSEHNRKLIPRMPNVYASPNVQTANGTTLYLGVAGPGTIFGAEKALSVRNITDGTSKTIMVVEADPDRAVPWSKPDDLHYNPDEPLAGLGHLRPGGFLAAFGDAHVTMISQAIAPDMLKALFTYAGREPVVFPGE